MKYDDLKNAFFEVWKDMKVITKLLKSCKPRNPEQPINLQDVLAYVLNAYLKHASKLNHVSYCRGFFRNQNQIQKQITGTPFYRCFTTILIGLVSSYF